MRYHEIIQEAPIGDISYHGGDEAWSMHADNIAIAKSPAAHAKIKRVLQRAPITINLMFINHKRNYGGIEPAQYFHHPDAGLTPTGRKRKPAAGRGPSDPLDIASGVMDSYSASRAFGIDIPYPKNAMTVVFGHDIGDDRMPFTPWMIAHRLMHAIWGAYRGERESPLKPLLQSFNRISINLPDGVIDSQTPLDVDSLMHAVGTWRSARQGRIGDAGEFIGEAFAQYLIQGRITFARIGSTIKPIIARRSAMLFPKLTIPDGHIIKVLDPDVLNSMVEDWRQSAEAVFIKTLQDFVGKIVVL
jgi:hypothetical protein